MPQLILIIILQPNEFSFFEIWSSHTSSPVLWVYKLHCFSGLLEFLEVMSFLFPIWQYAVALNKLHAHFCTLPAQWAQLLGKPSGLMFVYVILFSRGHFSFVLISLMLEFKIKYLVTRTVFCILGFSFFPYGSSLEILTERRVGEEPRDTFYKRDTDVFWNWASVLCLITPRLFLTLRGITGFFQGGVYVTLYVLTTEFVGPKHRSLAGTLVWIFYTSSLMLLSGLAYGIRDWRTLSIAISVPAFPLVLFWWWVNLHM